MLQNLGVWNMDSCVNPPLKLQWRSALVKSCRGMEQCDWLGTGSWAPSQLVRHHPCHVTYHVTCHVGSRRRSFYRGTWAKNVTYPEVSQLRTHTKSCVAATAARNSQPGLHQQSLQALIAQFLVRKIPDSILGIAKPNVLYMIEPQITTCLKEFGADSKLFVHQSLRWFCIQAGSSDWVGVPLFFISWLDMRGLSWWQMLCTQGFLLG